MAIKNTREVLHSLIDTIEDESVLNICKEILERERMRTQEVWDLISEEERKSIENGLADIEAGRVKSYEEVRVSIKQRFNF
ncbi:MAG: hypothetical protein SFW35_12495 [Chitinophagales bacterium]|nr:hypothetical protein [Chitinophagales bacterium]